MPHWASWRWSRTLLPKEIHSHRDHLRLALDSLRNAVIVDGNTGVPVALGLGLLLRECQRAIEVEPDDEDAPHVLRSSRLGAFDLDEVQAAVGEILGRLRNEVS